MNPIYKNELITYGVCSNFVPFAKKICDYFDIDSYIYSTSDDHVFLVAKINDEKRIFDFTRMIGIRDGYHNPNNQQIDDWFNMSFEKMFEYVPNRIIDRIDNIRLDVPITKDNFKGLINPDNESIKIHG